MSSPENQCSLLEDLDQRQNRVISELDELNERIESLLKDCLASRAAEEESLLDEDDAPATTVGAFAN